MRISFEKTLKKTFKWELFKKFIDNFVEKTLIKTFKWELFKNFIEKTLKKTFKWELFKNFIENFVEKTLIKKHLNGNNSRLLLIPYWVEENLVEKTFFWELFVDTYVRRASLLLRKFSVKTNVRWRNIC